MAAQIPASPPPTTNKSDLSDEIFIFLQPDRTIELFNKRN